MSMPPESEAHAEPTLFPESFLHSNGYEPIPFDGTEGFSDTAIAAIGEINDAFENAKPGELPTVEGKVIARYLVGIAGHLSSSEYSHILSHGVMKYSDDTNEVEPALQEPQSDLSDVAPQDSGLEVSAEEQQQEHTCGCAQCNLGYHCHNTSRGCTL